MSFSMSLAAPAVAVAFIDKSLLIGSGVNSGPLLPKPQTSLLGTPQMVFILHVLMLCRKFELIPIKIRFFTDF